MSQKYFFRLRCYSCYWLKLLTDDEYLNSIYMQFQSRHLNAAGGCSYRVTWLQAPVGGQFIKLICRAALEHIRRTYDRPSQTNCHVRADGRTAGPTNVGRLPAQSARIHSVVRWRCGCRPGPDATPCLTPEKVGMKGSVTTATIWWEVERKNTSDRRHTAA